MTLLSLFSFRNQEKENCMVGEVKKVKSKRREFQVKERESAKRLGHDSVLRSVNLQVELRANLF